MPNLGSTELIILLVVVLLVFGAKRLPDSARSLGRSLRIFKAETKGLRDDSSTDVREPYGETTVRAEPLPPAHPVQPPPPPGSYGTPPPAGSSGAGDQAQQQPRP